MSNQATIIQPLTDKQQDQVVEQTHFYIQKAITLYDLKKQAVDVVFNLKGRTSGMYRVSRQLIHYKRVIRYNPYIFSKYYEDSLSNTVPHEVAHYISDLLYGLNNIKPHGREWKAIMYDFNVAATVTANYDLTGIPQKKISLHTYQCGCREHQLSSIRHNKINKKRFQYYCNYCKKLLHIKTEANTFA